MHLKSYLCLGLCALLTACSPLPSAQITILEHQHTSALSEQSVIATQPLSPQAQEDPIGTLLSRIEAMDSPFEGYTISSTLREDYDLFFSSEPYRLFIHSQVPQINAQKGLSFPPEPAGTSPFTASSWFEPPLHVTALLPVNGAVLLAQDGSDQLLRVSRDGQVLEHIRLETRGGSALKRVSALATQQGKVYVLDTGAHVIWILDETLQVSARLPLPQATYSSDVHSIAIDEMGGIYVSKANTVFPSSGLFYWDGSGQWQDMGYFAGKLFSMDGEVYAANIKHVFAYAPRQSAQPGLLFDIEARSHQDCSLYSYLYRLEGGQMRISDAFPNFFTPTAFAVDGHTLYALSASYMKIYAFSLEAGKLSVLPQSICQEVLPLSVSHYEDDASLSFLNGQILLGLKSNATVLRFHPSDP